jgi:hypothetical protein
MNIVYTNTPVLEQWLDLFLDNQLEYSITQRTLIKWLYEDKYQMYSPMYSKVASLLGWMVDWEVEEIVYTSNVLDPNKP